MRQEETRGTRATAGAGAGSSGSGADQADTASGACSGTARGAEAPTEDEVFAAMSLDDLNKKAVLTDTFFALDSTELTPESRSAIQKNTDYMKRWNSTKVLVEGHADSRGTNEYNLALAERRAAAVRDYVVSLGVTAARVTVVSKGEEAPFCTEEAENCWQQNRRGHFIFTAK